MADGTSADGYHDSVEFLDCCFSSAPLRPNHPALKCWPR